MKLEVIKKRKQTAWNNWKHYEKQAVEEPDYEKKKELNDSGQFWYGKWSAYKEVENELF